MVYISHQRKFHETRNVFFFDLRCFQTWCRLFLSSFYFSVLFSFAFFQFVISLRDEKSSAADLFTPGNESRVVVFPGSKSRRLRRPINNIPTFSFFAHPMLYFYFFHLIQRRKVRVNITKLYLFNTL